MLEFLFLALCLGIILWVFGRLGHRDKPPPTVQDTFPPAPTEPRTERQPETSVAVRSTAHKPKVDHAPPPEIPTSRELKGRAWVIDGDTIVVSKIKVRLSGIDAPELDQPWGKKSKWEMVRLCKGQIITVKLTGDTSYDRLVGTCYLPDGRDLGAEIIKAGLALDGGHFSKGKYKHLEDPEMRKKLRGYGHWR